MVRRRVAEQHTQNSVPAQGADEFAKRAIGKEEHEQPKLDRPEVGPHNFVKKAAVRRRELAGEAPEMDEMLGVTDGERREEVDGGLPHDVVHQRLVGEAVDEGEVIRKEDDLGDDERSQGRGKEDGGTDPVLPEHQGLSEGEELEGEEEEHGDWNELPEFFQDFLAERAAV